MAIEIVDIPIYPIVMLNYQRVLIMCEMWPNNMRSGKMEPPSSLKCVRFTRCRFFPSYRFPRWLHTLINEFRWVRKRRRKRKGKKEKAVPLSYTDHFWCRKLSFSVVFVSESCAYSFFWKCLQSSKTYDHLPGTLRRFSHAFVGVPLQQTIE